MFVGGASVGSHSVRIGASVPDHGWDRISGCEEDIDTGVGQVTHAVKALIYRISDQGEGREPVWVDS